MDEQFLIPLSKACKRYSMGLNNMRRVAEEAQALVRVNPDKQGGKVLVVVSKMDEYFVRMTERDK